MKKIVMNTVESSQIRSIGYDPDSETMYVEFTNGIVYQYFDVPEHVFNDFKSNDASVGKFFYAKIKGVYGYAKTTLAVADGYVSFPVDKYVPENTNEDDKR